MSDWPARREAPALEPRQVHLWRADLDELAKEVAVFQQLLVAEEVERAGRFVFERDADRYVVGRGMLRRLLASYSPMSNGQSVVLRYGSHGKPAFRLGDANPLQLQFNLAHSGGFALVGFTRAVELGVDVESVHRLSDMGDVMRSFFARGERESVAALGSEREQCEAFFRCWTRKEAVLKAMGWGLAKALDSFEVSLDDDRPRVLRMEGAETVNEWRLVHVNPKDGFVGAAAWVGPEMTVQCFTFQP